MSLHFEDFGTGRPVVLIHAFPLSAEMWKRQATLLGVRNYRVILPDLPGFGAANSTIQFFTIGEMARRIAAILKTLKIEKAIIGGLSMGGYVAFDLYRQFPELFSALILCDTTYLADSLEKRNSRFDLISKIESSGAAALIENMLPNLISDETKQNNPDLLDKLTGAFSKVNPVSAINALRSMAERADSSDIIEQITFPTLLIFGEFDKVTNLEIAGKMKELIPGSELFIIKKAGHYTNLEQPDQFNNALIDFCDRVKFL